MLKIVTSIKTMIGLAGFSMLIAYLLSKSLIDNGIIISDFRVAMLLIFIITYIITILSSYKIYLFIQNKKSNINAEQNAKGRYNKQKIKTKKEGERSASVKQLAKGNNNEQDIEMR